MTLSFPKVCIVDIPGKGQGVRALEDIPRGTLIIAETLKVRYPMKRDLITPEAIECLLSFPCAPTDHPIIGRFKHFLPLVGSSDEGHGLFATICKVNHTCPSPLDGPNAAYCWDEPSGKELLHAIHDIHRNEEITVSYIHENSEASQDPLTFLRKHFGFDCSCRGCLRPAAERQHSAKRIKAFYQFDDLVLEVINSKQYAPLSILKDIEKQLLIVCEEGYESLISRFSHNAFQLCALYGDAASASEWEALTRDMGMVYCGEKSKDVQESFGHAKDPSTHPAWGGFTFLGKRKLHGPCKEIVAYCYPPSTLASTLSPEPLVPAPGKLSKGQKKKARAKAKKTEKQPGLEKD
ncbi:hypothetical protein BDP27DRAFT_318515 [Rhodocollybia butyracea]|uniref:SET domain-containing protein n=1 Tax=Rhodocollybia butyracea TaxID=206335 RepID=A0A9P5Q265_9AGAR|nr:hypothetical protein BDP27DRAFT_318515 [Rhodocollybia butyracea]